MADRKKQRVVVLGGGYAGMMAVARLLRGKPNAEVTLVDAREEFAQRIRFHELLAGRTPGTYRYAPLLARRGARFQQGWVERVDLAEGCVLGRDAAGGPLALAYDYLVLTLGSRTRAEARGVAQHALRLDDPEAIRTAALRLPELARRGGRVLVVGGGLTGLETAAELAERHPGLQICLISREKLGATLSHRGGVHLKERFSARRIEVRDEAGVTALEAGSALLTDGTLRPFDLCIWCAGFEPSPVVREAGLKTAPDGRAVVDNTLRSVSHPEVFVAGDTARVRANGEEVRMSCAAAFAMGAHAGDNLAQVLTGEEPQPFHFGFGLRCVSLGRKDALVQMTEPNDTPVEKVVTGRGGALIKELICRMTLGMPQWELNTGRALYRWPCQEGPQPSTGTGAARLEEKGSLSR